MQFTLDKKNTMCPTINSSLRVRSRVADHRHHKSSTRSASAEQIQSASRPPLLASTEGPRPFFSSLIDTVRVVINCIHEPLEEIAAASENMKRDGYVYYVKCPRTIASAQVFAYNGNHGLTMEFSIPKFMTGQNLVGTEDLRAGSAQCIFKVLELMGVEMTAKEAAAIEAGRFRLTRVDVAAHIDCGTADRASAMMVALRNLIVGKAKDVSFYGIETLYIGQHSRRRSLKLYRKDIELAGHPMPANVYRRERLTEKATGLIRFELVLRRDELSDIGFDSPVAWTSNVARELVQKWADRLRQVQGRVPDVAHLDELSPVLQQKLRSWLLGDSIAVSRNVAHQTYRASRNRILKVTGIDVDSHLTAEQQRQALLTVRELFDRGFGFRDHSRRWGDLVAAVEG